ncbi:MAG TPA: hypothetical protein H9868_03265, partial [Candidatus Flavonifractor merdipullorum]|nr:hypothetical protein [Candidatus Flavonifractor merdipullorum]
MQDILRKQSGQCREDRQNTGKSPCKPGFVKQYYSEFHAKVQSYFLEIADLEGHTGKGGKNSGCFVEKYKSVRQKDTEKGALAISSSV